MHLDYKFDSLHRNLASVILRCARKIYFSILYLQYLLCDQLSHYVSSWEGKDDHEIGRNKANGKVIVKVNPKYYRPTEVVSMNSEYLCSETKIAILLATNFLSQILDWFGLDI